MAAGDSSAASAHEALGPARAGLPKRCPKCGERYPADFRVCPRDAFELEAPAGEVDDPYVGTTLGGSYRIDAVIADGGMGRVYEARHVRLPDRSLAVKILHRTLAGDVEVVSRFRREAEIADAIDHPNVIRVFDVQSTPDGVPFIVTEFLRGEDLGQRLEREGRLSIADTVHILGQVCDVLAAVHARGVIHRDLKPNNLFLVGDPARPTVKLIDFGIARLRGPDDAKATQTGVVMGTPAFMAPEQARGERVDARADIYAVGAIAYCCVTGRGPYDLNDAAAALHAVLMSEPPRPRSVAPDVPEDFEMVLQRAMARDREERYPTLEALGEAFAGFHAGGSDGPTVPGSSAIVATRALGRGDGELAAVARRARPELAAMSAVAFVILVGGLAEALTAAFTASSLPGAAGRLAVLAAVATLATPAYLYIRFLRMRVWPNSPQALTWSRNVAMVVSVGVCAYASSYLLGRLFDLALGEGDGPDGWGRVAPWVIGLGAGGAAWFTRARRRYARAADTGEVLAGTSLHAGSNAATMLSGVTRR
ncbi:MAG: serine/threonine protein kinase [Nannocystis sp.]|uniref:serine/threonine-protein kinase n=1 Tax=Nannocystis sp. TaxID=1962667 RepID=UPI0024273D59|nr:serine/threonine-protein kinase [Nannocystis sp.]MBK9752623.1 serine/threonine protein kinase [Nannocystis sp.]